MILWVYICRDCGHVQLMPTRGDGAEICEMCRYETAVLRGKVRAEETPK